MIFAYLKSKGMVRKILMIVPNSNLVFQGNDDFEEYGLDKLDGVKIQQIGGGSKIKDGCDIIIGTYQSLVKRESDFFDEVDCVFIDECLSPDSLVSMADGGYKKISDVNIGDSVLTINDITNGQEKRTVEFVYKNLNKDKQMYKIETECGKILKVTGNHKVKLKNGEWKRVDALNYSDELFDI
jgi:intein/homing endonuclease